MMTHATAPITHPAAQELHFLLDQICTHYNREYERTPLYRQALHERSGWKENLARAKKRKEKKRLLQQKKRLTPLLVLTYKFHAPALFFFTRFHTGFSICQNEIEHKAPSTLSFSEDTIFNSPDIVCNQIITALLNTPTSSWMQTQVRRLHENTPFIFSERSLYTESEIIKLRQFK